MAKPEFPLTLKTRRNYWKAIYYNRKSAILGIRIIHIPLRCMVKEELRRVIFFSKVLFSTFWGNILICCQDIGENSGRKQDKRQVGEISPKSIAYVLTYPWNLCKDPVLSASSTSSLMHRSATLIITMAFLNQTLRLFS